MTDRRESDRGPVRPGRPTALTGLVGQARQVGQVVQVVRAGLNGLVATIGLLAMAGVVAMVPPVPASAGGAVAGTSPNLAPTATPAATPATTAEPRTDSLRPDDIGLVLIDQTFVVGPNERIRLEYELDGDDVAIERALLDDVNAEITSQDEDDDTPRPSPTSVVVRVHEPLDERGRVASSLAGATGPWIDEITLPLIDVVRAEDGRLILTLDLATTDGSTPTTDTDDTDDTDTRDTDTDTGDAGDSDDSDDTGEAEEADGDTDTPTLEVPAPGLHPLSIQVRTADGRLLTQDVTFVERVAGGSETPLRRQPFGISVVAAIPDPGPEPDRLALVDARSRLVEIAQLGEALPGGLTVAIPPVVATALQSAEPNEFDEPDDPDAPDELDQRVRLALAGSEILAAPRITFDPSSAVAAEEGDAFTRELREGEDVLARAFPDTSVRRSAWLWQTPLSLPGAALLRDLGVPLLVVPFDAYLGLDNALPVEFTDPSLLYTVVLPGGATMAVGMIDPIAELLDPDLVDPRSPTALAVEIVATLSATRLQLPDAPRVALLSTPTLDVPDADVAAAIARLVEDHPDMRIRPLSFVPSSTDVMIVNGERRDVGLPLSAGPRIEERSRSIAHTRELAASYGSMLPDDDDRHAMWDDELDRLLSTWFTDDDANERIDAVATDIRRVPDSIGLPEGYTFTLTGQSSEITLRITNTSNTPLRVQLRPDAPKLAFPDDTKDVELEPGTNNITIPVTVLSNGTFPVTIDVLTPYDQRPVIEPIVLRARATALTGLGQVLTGGALLVLASWWYSHIRSRRRLRSSLAKRNHPSTPSGSVARS